VAARDYRRYAQEACPVTTEAGTDALIDALAAAQHGGGSGAELFPLFYNELHRLAESQLRRNAGAATLGATTLLHEAYLALSARTAPFIDRARFFGYAARAMRGLIIDYVRERRALKRGGEFHITSLATTFGESTPAGAADLSPLGDALLELADVEPELAELVDLKFFCGFSFEEIAAMRGVSRRTIHRDWDRARIFLRGVLNEP
jgi:RNA polymerase sigma factor (TIGR02999 family)